MIVLKKRVQIPSNFYLLGGICYFADHLYCCLQGNTSSIRSLCCADNHHHISSMTCFSLCKLQCAYSIFQVSVCNHSKKTTVNSITYNFIVQETTKFTTQKYVSHEREDVNLLIYFVKKGEAHGLKHQGAYTLLFNIIQKNT